MSLFFRTVWTIAICLVGGTCVAQTKHEVFSLCTLQEKAAEGNRMNVRVSGVYSVGPESSTLDDSACPNRSTWVEFDLRSKRNDRKLRSRLARSQQACVVLEGEF